MTLVKPKSDAREAWQYTGQPPWDWPVWVQSRCTPLPDGEAILTRRSGQQILNATDWLVRDLDGDPEWLTHDQMRKAYEEVAG